MHCKTQNRKYKIRHAVPAHAHRNRSPMLQRRSCYTGAKDVRRRDRHPAVYAAAAASKLGLTIMEDENNKTDDPKVISVIRLGNKLIKLPPNCRIVKPEPGTFIGIVGVGVKPPKKT
jgi:hypothetical protein